MPKNVSESQNGLTYYSTSSGYTTSFNSVASRNQCSIAAGPLGDFKVPRPHNISGLRTKCAKGTVFSVTPDGTSWTKYSGVVGRDYGPLHTTNPSAHGFRISDAQCLNSLTELIRGSTDLSVDAFQAKQTSQMLKPIRRLRDLGVNLRRGWRGTIQQLSSLRLEWTYGWKPAMSSIYGTVEEMTRTTELYGIPLKARAAYVEKDAEFTTTGALVTNTHCHVIPQGNTSWRTEMCVWLSVPSSTTRLDRLTSLNPLSIGYELIPYSFVLDWVWNMGGYLRDLETAILYSSYFKMGYKTQSWKQSGTYRIGRASGTPRGTSINATGSYDNFARYRMYLSSFPAPSLPPFRCELGSGRLLNLAALLGSKL
jgi:hypothetical protein